MPEILRVSKRVALTCATRQISWYPESTWILNWFNKAGTGMNPWGFTCWQPILVYGKDPYLENSKGSRPDYIEHSEASPKNGHPCPKPLAWATWLVSRAAMSGGTVLDPFMGSGTTDVACARLARKFWGIEIEPKYFDIACKRIELAYKQRKLFTPEELEPTQGELL